MKTQLCRILNVAFHETWKCKDKVRIEKLIRKYNEYSFFKLSAPNKTKGNILNGQTCPKHVFILETLLKVDCYEGFISSGSDLCDICVNYDIVLLQETWIHEEDLLMLSNMHPCFTDFGSFGFGSQ